MESIPFIVISKLIASKPATRVWQIEIQSSALPCLPVRFRILQPPLQTGPFSHAAKHTHCSDFMRLKKAYKAYSFMFDLQERTAATIRLVRNTSPLSSCSNERACRVRAFRSLRLVALAHAQPAKLSLRATYLEDMLNAETIGGVLDH